MRSAAFAVCLAWLAIASGGCTPGVPVIVPKSPAAKLGEVKKPVAIIAPVDDDPLGEDEHGKPVYPATLETIKLSLKDPDVDVRRAAFKKLTHVRWKLPASVTNLLTQALTDADAEIRLEAVRMAATEALRTADIAQMLADKDSRVRTAAARMLVAQGKREEDAYPILAAALKDARTEDRRAILELIEVKGSASRALTPALIAISLDAKDPLRVEAIAGLVHLGGGQEAIDCLLLTAHEAEPKARAAALRALSRLDPGSAKVQVALCKGLRDANVEVRLAATEGVGSDGIAALIEMLRQGDDRLRRAAAAALGRHGSDAWSAVPELTRLAQSDSSEEVRRGAQAAVKAIVP